jgi:galactokinase
MKAKNKIQLVAFSIITIGLLSLVPFYLLSNTTFGYFDFHISAIFILACIFAPSIIVDNYNERKNKCKKALIELIENKYINNRKELNHFVNKASKVYSLSTELIYSELSK